MRAIRVLFAAAVCAAWPAGALAGTEGYGNAIRIDCAPHGPCVAADDRNNVTVAADPAGRWAWAARTTDVYAAPAVACTDAGLCVAAGLNGHVPTGSDGYAAVSRDALTAAPTWSPSVDTGLGGIPYDAACTPSGQCVVVGYSSTPPNSGAVATTADATTWHGQHLSDAVMSGVDCPTDGLCVAVDQAGRVWTTRDPGATAPQWTSTQLGSDPLVDISCASAALCVAIGEHGLVSRSSSPGADAPQWTTDAVPVAGELGAVACPSEALCLAVDATGRVYASTSPAQDGPWAMVFDGIAYPSNQYWVAIACTVAPLCILTTVNGYKIAVSRAPADAGSWRTDSRVFNEAIGTTQVGKPRVHGARVRLPLSCTPPPVPGSCKGTALLRDRRTGATWVRRTFNIPSIEPSRSLSLRLPARIRRRLARNGHLDATLQVTAAAQSLSIPAPHEQVLRRRVRF